MPRKHGDVQNHEEYSVEASAAIMTSPLLTYTIRSGG
jgi:hypothetical protein